MGKFALRGLAQSMARELAPKNIHVAHFVIDGGIATGADPRGAERGEDGMLLPDEIAKNYLHVYRQPPQRLELGARAQALGREVLSVPIQTGCCPRIVRTCQAESVRWSVQ